MNSDLGTGMDYFPTTYDDWSWLDCVRLLGQGVERGNPLAHCAEDREVFFQLCLSVFPTLSSLSTTSSNPEAKWVEMCRSSIVYVLQKSKDKDFWLFMALQCLLSSNGCGDFSAGPAWIRSWLCSAATSWLRCQTIDKACSKAQQSNKFDVCIWALHQNSLSNSSIK